MCYNFSVRRECVKFFPTTDKKENTVNTYIVCYDLNNLGPGVSGAMMGKALLRLDASMSPMMGSYIVRTSKTRKEIIAHLKSQGEDTDHLLVEQIVDPEQRLDGLFKRS